MLSKVDEPVSRPFVPIEPVVALLGAAAVLSAQTLTKIGDLWLLLDVVGLVAGTAAVWLLLRRKAVERDQPALAEEGFAVLAAGLSAAFLLLGLRGPQPRIATMLFLVVGVAGILFTVLILISAVTTARQARTGSQPILVTAAVRSRIPEVVTVVAATAAFVGVVLDAVRR